MNLLNRKLAFQKRNRLSEDKDHIYKELFCHYPDGLFLLDVHGYLTEVNRGLEKLTGYSKDELLYSHFSQYIFNEDLEKVRTYFKEALNGTVHEREFRIVNKSNEMKMVSTNIVSATIKGERKGVYGAVKDITDKKYFETAIKRFEKRFESLVQNSSDVIGILDENGKIKYQSQVVREVLGYDPDQMIDKSCFTYIYSEDLKLVEGLFKQALNLPNQSITAEFRVKKASGEYIYCEVNLKNLLDDESVAGIVTNYRDISERKKHEQEIQYAAYHDYLTGLPNRNSLVDVLVNELTNNNPMALLCIDLDRFKVINDNMGHDIGDLLLKRVTERLKFTIDEQDILFRQGGDEFIIFLPGGDRQRAIDVSETIIEALSSPITINMYDIYTSPSIGISLFPDDGETVEKLINHADYAMYEAKKKGKNTYRFYSVYEDHVQVNPLKLEMDLRRAIMREEFLLYYQPKINLKTGKMVGVEALIRWSHPELGLVSPASFIPLAEETGMIIPIGKWAIYTACVQNKKWQNLGLPELIVSVNLSVRQFSQANLVKTVADILEETGLEPCYLELEVTESMTANSRYAIKTLQQLKDLGVLISIDDFGTGFSSLNYLKEFPVDTLKIDQSFVRELHNNSSDQTIVKTIISMARNLNMSVVAEGIETREQLVFLQQHLCNEGQGYFFSKPLPAKELSENMMNLEQLIKLHGIPQNENESMWEQEFVRMAKHELRETLRRQQGMTLKFKKVNGKFIHTLCEGELIYQLGLIPEEVVGKELKEVLPKEAAEKKESCYLRAWNGEERVTYETCLNGIYYMAALKPIKRGGKVIEVIVSCIDITKLKSTEKALRSSEEKYRLITNHVTDLICMLDNNGHFVYASPSYERELGTHPSELVNSSCIDIIHPEDEALFISQYSQLLDSRKSFDGEFRFKHVTGSWVTMEANFTPIINDLGSVNQIVVVARNITEKRKAEELLWKFEKLSVAGELAAGVAHEIRNPITSIKGFIQLFREGMMKEEYFDVINKEFKQLDEIIDEFLVLAKPRDLKFTKTPPQALLESLGELIDAKATLQIDLDRDLPLIMCDPKQIKKVFKNLLKNSNEAMPNGGVVKIKAKQENSYLVIEVIDEGIGISQDRIDTLGEPFYSNKEKGIGMGLMVSFKIIRDHNGMISIVSEEEKGTTVEVRLPILS